MHEEVVREFRDVCLGKSTTCSRIYERKFFYLFTCEYCFSHYIAAVFLLITRFKGGLTSSILKKTPP